MKNLTIKYLNLPKVSVLIPTYNRSAFLKQAIESVLNQSLQDFEIIVVDNFSTDNTEEVMQVYSKNGNIIYVKNSANLGAVNNYNRALRLASGQYIHLFSDDDIMNEPDNLAIKAKILDDFPNVGLVHSFTYGIDECGIVKDTKQHIPEKNWAKLYKNSPVAKGKICFDILYNSSNFISMPTVMLRKSILDANKLEFNNQLNYLIDWDMWLKMSFLSDFYYINRPLVYYRTHTNNETNHLLHKYYEIHFLELFILKCSLLNLLQGFENSIDKKLGTIFISTIKQLKEVTYLKYFPEKMSFMSINKMFKFICKLLKIK